MHLPVTLSRGTELPHHCAYMVPKRKENTLIVNAPSTHKINAKTNITNRPTVTKKTCMGEIPDVPCTC